MVAIHNQQTWGLARGDKVERKVHRERRVYVAAPIRPHWLRISLLAGLAAFWSGVAALVVHLL